MPFHVLATDQSVGTHLLVMTPCVIAVANPWTVKHAAHTARLAAGVTLWVVVCMAVLAAAPQNPAALCWDEEE